MASKPVIIVAILFAATIVSAVIGYYYYHSYRSLLASLEAPPTLEDALSRVRSLRYTMHYYNGSSWIVLVNIDSAHRVVNITYMDGNGTVLAYYLIGYSGDQIVSARKIDPETGNETAMDIAKIEDPFRTNIRVLTMPTGETGVEPFPGIGPIYSLYAITKSLSIDWLGHEETSQVRTGWTPIEYTLEGKSLRAVRVEAIPAHVLVPSPYASLTRLIAVVAIDKGITFFPEIYYASGETYLTVNVTSISFTH